MIEDKYKKIMEDVINGKLKISKVVVTSKDENGIWSSRLESSCDINDEG